MTHELTDEAKRLLEEYGSARWNAGFASASFDKLGEKRYDKEADESRAALLAHLAQRGTSEQECGNTPYDEGPFTLASPQAQRSETQDGIRIFPAQSVRVETGPVQFGDDWPGVFIRGDNAYYYAGLIRAVIEGHADAFTLACLQGLHAALAGSDLTGVSRRPFVASPEAVQPMPEGVQEIPHAD